MKRHPIALVALLTSLSVAANAQTLSAAVPDEKDFPSLRLKSKTEKEVVSDEPDNPISPRTLASWLWGKESNDLTYRVDLTRYVSAKEALKEAQILVEGNRPMQPSGLFLEKMGDQVWSFPLNPDGSADGSSRLTVQYGRFVIEVFAETKIDETGEGPKRRLLSRPDVQIAEDLALAVIKKLKALGEDGKP